MIVCICKAVNDRAIRRAVAEGHDTFDDLQFELGIGTQCGKCVSAACEVLCEARLEAQATQPHTAAVSSVRFVARPSTREVALA
ncbi:MAG: (2Fe-2S)-binding protein [Burkholderiaceae bacterium]